jgi:DNA helicase IV
MSEISRERQYIERSYQRVDALREQASARLALALAQADGTAQSRIERDAAISRYSEQLARLDAADSGLCFGRLDLRTGECLHIGRIGLRDESGEGEPLLLDWRAPAARAFYVATAGAAHGVRRRRSIAMRGRRVTGLDDEVLDRRELSDACGLTGEAALLAALDATRTGKMRDIVGTLQAEQDAIIRAAPSGILVVQGGPGTGKTAVALHRAAYLLYTHRRLAERGVLVVGPSATFLGYISQVLPGLGETNVLLRTVGELFPGITAGRAEDRLAEEVKGRAMMADVLAAAVRDRQATGPAEIEFAGETLRLDRQVVAERAAADRTWTFGHVIVDMATTRDALPAALAEITAAEAVSAGHLAVIVPDAQVEKLGDAVARVTPGVSFGENPDLTNGVVLLGARQAKGLEFDSVLIADPAAILTGSPHGRNDLYVAMTRSTQRLGILHPGRPPR